MIVRNNKYKKITKIAFGIIWAAPLIYFGWYCTNNYLNSNHQNNHDVEYHEERHVDETPVSNDDKEKYTVPADNPRFISIPDLNVDRARIVPLGVINKTKQLDTPISIYDAGWYTGSAKPGESGAMLMDGHNGGPRHGGIFDKLGDLKEGAKIIIERGDGHKYSYKVIDNRELSLSEMNNPNNKYGMATAQESIENGKNGLNIITCVGEWIPSKNTFDKRVILRAVQE